MLGWNSCFQGSYVWKINSSSSSEMSIYLSKYLNNLMKFTEKRSSDQQ